MNIKKYFWSLNSRAIREVKAVLKDSRRPQFIERAYTLLSRCDNPKEVFSVVKKAQFISNWPRVRSYWIKKGQAADFRAWWETIYEQLLQGGRAVKAPKGAPAEIFFKLGTAIKDRRLKMKISQSDFARRAGMKQPDISAIELGKKNITLKTLIRICRILEIKSLPFS